MIDGTTERSLVKLEELIHEVLHTLLEIDEKTLSKHARLTREMHSYTYQLSLAVTSLRRMVQP